MASDIQVRRATIDDLRILQELWASMQLSPDDLESKLTEFQIAVSPDGSVAGAVGMEIIGRHGRIHDEVFMDFAQADALRELFWQRLLSVAKNHGLTRLWTTESAPFWKTNGLLPPKSGELKKLPEAWAASKGQWMTLQLRDEEALDAALEKALAEFKGETTMLRKKAEKPLRTLNMLATAFAIILAAAVIIASVYMLRNYAVRR
jgi:N-acetylglutamate synthase-like GNAT family acetyltransferase